MGGSLPIIHVPLGIVTVDCGELMQKRLTGRYCQHTHVINGVFLLQSQTGVMGHIFHIYMLAAFTRHYKTAEQRP